MKIQRNRESTFLNYRENNIIYASYLQSFVLWALLEGAKFANGASWNTVEIYLQISIVSSCIVVLILICFYKLRLVKSYLQRKYVLPLTFIPITVSYVSLTVLVYLDETISTEIGDIYFFIHILLMFIIRFWILKKWIEFDQKRIPLQRGEKVYLGETTYQANNRFDWNS